MLQIERKNRLEFSPLYFWKTQTLQYKWISEVKSKTMWHLKCRPSLKIPLGGGVYLTMCVNFTHHKTGQILWLFIKIKDAFFALFSLCILLYIIGFYKNDLWKYLNFFMVKEPVKSFVGMFRKMKISLYDNWRTAVWFWWIMLAY